MKRSVLAAVASCSLLWIMLAATATAQHSQKMTGRILDLQGQPVTDATIVLFRTVDSSLIKMAISDENGNYEFTAVPADHYFTKISYVGFDPYTSEEIRFDGIHSMSLGDIKLTQGSVELSGVTVTAQKPMIEVRSDKTVVNVESSITAQGSNVLEILQKSPGVMVDQNENIYLKGRAGIQIQIDGKPTPLSGTDLTEYLKSIQASDLETIELISNPSSKYEAEGAAGIINIKFKKNRSYGTNGTIAAGYAISIFPKYNTSLSMNHRNKDVNLFGTYGNNWGQRQNNFNLYRIQNDTLYDQLSKSIFGGLRNNFKAGVDYYIHPRHTVGVLINGTINNITGETSSHTDISDQATGTEQKILTATTQNQIDLNNLNFNGNYRFADTSGHELNADIDYGVYRNDRSSYQTNTYTTPDGSQVLDERFYRTIAPTEIDIFTVKLDYSQSFLKGKIGTGFKVSRVQTDNVFNFYNVIDGDDQLDEDQSNQFDYTENINAVYLNYQRTIQDLDFQLGLRTEQTYSLGDLTTINNQPDEQVKRNYLDFFPSAGITYNLNPKNSLALTYSSRITRPNYQELNPFEYKIDELTFRKGNPFLDPMYTDKIELTHTFNFSLNTSLSYSYTTDFFAQYTDTTEGNKSFITTRNLADEEIISLDVNTPYEITKWWSTFISASAYYQRYYVLLEDANYPEVTTWSFNFYNQHTFKLPHGFSLEVSGWYSSPSIWGAAYRSTASGSVDAGLQKKLFKDRGTLKLTVTDIFYTTPWESENEYGNLYLKAYGNWESRQFRMNFSYRFGNNQVKGARQRNTGSDSEMQRTGGGE